MAVLYRLRNAAGPDPWDWQAVRPKDLPNFNIDLFLQNIARQNCLNPQGIYKVEGFLIERKLAKYIIQEQRNHTFHLEELYNEIQRLKQEAITPKPNAYFLKSPKKKRIKSKRL